ncbi:alpha-(1,3)-fucosyltransferase 10 isoform X2 [Patella vulgata]|nr:alpha-(1,3)-fucosyltransferase 10 isoform X2 [Patella vulgata]
MASKSTIPLILRWEPISGEGEGKITCGQDVCEVTSNKSRKAEQSIMIYSFYGSHFKMHDLPLPRRAGDLWALVHEESPKNNHYIFSNLEILQLFNLTSTFKRQSSYPLTTFGLRDHEKIMDRTFLLTLEEKNRYRKLGLAPIVYVQSGCDAPSDRDKLVYLLQQYIPIDSYGRCMKNKDFPKSLSFDDDGSMAPMESDEFYAFLSRYKFALAFENAICDDYVTEKFWRPIQIGVVPIVFGSPTIKDFLPDEKSAIITSDYSSVKELADHLWHLDEHDDEFSQHLQFKFSGITNPKLKKFIEKREWGRGKAAFDMFTAYTCFLCHTIHDIKRDPKKFYNKEFKKVDLSHYGCPAPLRFDSNGIYNVVDSWWQQEWTFSKYLARAAKYYHDNNEIVSPEQLNSFAQVLYKTGL